MLEHIGESGIFEWWGVFKNSTPEEAILHYNEDMGIDEKETQTIDGNLYNSDETARAYEIDLL